MELKFERESVIDTVSCFKFEHFKLICLWPNSGLMFRI